MQYSTYLLVASTFFMAAGSATAASTINFDNVFASGGNNSYLPVNTDGFAFTSTHGHVITEPTVCYGGCADNGTQYLGGDMADLLMTSTGGAFDVYAFDAAKAFYTENRPSSIFVEGTFVGGGTISAYFALAANDFSTISLTGFTGLSSLRFNGAYADGTPANLWIGVDNIKLSAVPEVGHLTLMLAGLGTVAGVMARRRRYQPSV